MVTSSASSPLLPVTKNSIRKPSSWIKAPGSCCIGSKAARLILLWNFAVLLAYSAFYNIDLAMQVTTSSVQPIIFIVGYTIVAVFSPIAGLMTDIKFSRYKAVIYSSYAIIAILVAVSAVLIAAPVVAYYKPEEFGSNSKNLIIAVTIYSGVILAVTVFIVFIINALQFGMDQLHDSPTEDSILFIHWYVWIYYTCSFVTEIIWNLLLYDNYELGYVDSLRILAISLLCLMMAVIFTLLAVSFCVLHFRKVWFLLEPAGVNPYKLVYRATKFACLHKVPLRRSAFTYCTEELPSRMDVGKHKYGGPFTTKQVEDVKAFWGILKVVLTIGPAFLLQTVSQSILPAFAKHSTIYFMENENSTTRQFHIEGPARHIIISNGLLSPLLVVICIPLYLCCIRPHIKYHIPGTLKRIGLANIVMIIALTSTFIMDFVVHRSAHVGCMFSGYSGVDVITTNTVFKNSYPAPPLYQNVYFFTSQHVLSAVANMLLDTAVLEFICSQSPYSMKGLLLGIFISMKSLFQGIAITFIVPFGAAWTIRSLSCGSGFYLMNIIIGLVALLLYACAAKKYKYREVNEPSHEYRYAEEYYSNIQ